MEITYAIRHELILIPVLIDGAQFPSEIELPDEIAPLVRRQYFKLRKESFSADIDRLIPVLFNATRMQGSAILSSDGLDIGSAFRDFESGPELVVLPSGHFLIGSPAGEDERMKDEGPQRLTMFSRPFAIGRFAVTFREWDCYLAEEINVYNPSDGGWGRDGRPVVNVSWEDAQSYLAWASKKAGTIYRLPSEAEWEYAARAGSATAYWWGERADLGRARYSLVAPDGEPEGGTVPVNSFSPNPWGLFNVHGNVWEWVEDNWSDNYLGKSGNGEALIVTNKFFRVVRGGSWRDGPSYIRSATRNYERQEFRGDMIGFRVVRDL
jgi:formylglycine-generating enzyme required for sulfatase activity